MAVSRRILFAIAAIILAAIIVVIIAVAVRSNDHGPTAGGAAGTAGAGATSTPGPSASTGTSDPTSGFSVGATPRATADPGSSSGQARPAVGLKGTASMLPALTVRLTSLVAVTGKSGGVGEVSGPAIMFTVSFDNATKKAVDLSSTVVTVTYGSKNTPSDEIATARKSFPATAKAGATASGTFTFSIPAEQRSAVRITVDYGVSAPSVVFQGAIPA